MRIMMKKKGTGVLVEEVIYPDYTTHVKTANYPNPDPNINTGSNIVVSASENKYAYSFKPWGDTSNATITVRDKITHAVLRQFTYTAEEANFGGSFDMTDDMITISLSTASGNGQVKVYNLNTGSLIRTYTNTTDPVETFFGTYVKMTEKYTAIRYYNLGSRLDIYNTVTGSFIRSVYNPNIDITDTNDGWANGSTVDIHGDYLVTGAPFEDIGGPSSGTVYVHNLVTGEVIHTLQNPNSHTGDITDQFGSSVVMFGDYIIATAGQEDVATSSDNAGKVYIFSFSTGLLIDTIVNPSPTAAAMGKSLSMYGNYLAISHEQSDSGKGQVYIVDMRTRSIVQTISNPNAVSGTHTQDWFGDLVYLYDDTLITRSPLEDYPGGSGDDSVGHVYVFELS